MTRWTLSIAELVQFDPGYLLAPQVGEEKQHNLLHRENSTRLILAGFAHPFEERKAAYQPCLQYGLSFFALHCAPDCSPLHCEINCNIKGAIPKANSKNKAIPLTLPSLLMYSISHE